MSRGVMGDPHIWESRRLSEMREAIEQVINSMRALKRIADSGQWPDDWAEIVPHDDFARHVAALEAALPKLCDDCVRLDFTSHILRIRAEASHEPD